MLLSATKWRGGGAVAMAAAGVGVDRCIGRHRGAGM